jgi:hypothetical protein
MSKKSAKTVNSPNNPSHLFAGTSKNPNRSICSESIAADISAFKKSGGRIEVLGTTPLRVRATPSTFRSKGNTPAAPAAPAAAAAKATG